MVKHAAYEKTQYSKVGSVTIMILCMVFCKNISLQAMIKFPRLGDSYSLNREEALDEYNNFQT